MPSRLEHFIAKLGELEDGLTGERREHDKVEDRYDQISSQDIPED